MFLITSGIYFLFQKSDASRRALLFLGLVQSIRSLLGRKKLARVGVGVSGNL